MFTSGTEEHYTNSRSSVCPEDRDGTGYTISQKEVAERTREYVLDHLERHVTIAELAREMHVSQTQIKVCFHRVYGFPVFAWARRCRMEAAAKLLEQTDESVLEIAGKFGYENGSKFATAFRSVTGESPSAYRRRVYWERENDQKAAPGRDA